MKSANPLRRGLALNPKTKAHWLLREQAPGQLQDQQGTCRREIMAHRRLPGAAKPSGVGLRRGSLSLHSRSPQYQRADYIWFGFIPTELGTLDFQKIFLSFGSLPIGFYLNL